MVIYLAGAESWRKRMKEWDTKYVLTSYFYLRNKGTATVEAILNDFDKVFLDSGAFTLQQQMLKQGIPIHTAIESDMMHNYIADYIKFINEYGKYFDLVAEVDVGSWQQKTRFREVIQGEITKEINLVPVVHRTDPDNYLDYLCTVYPYIAFGALRSNRSQLKSYFTKRMVVLKRHGTQSHGFAVTVVDLMRDLGLTSVDSASWLHGSKHGMTFYFDGRELRSYDKFNKWIRCEFKSEVKNLGINWDEFMDDKARAVDNWNLYQWVTYQKYMESEGWGLGGYKKHQEQFWRERHDT
jgi:hypothetical protein